jgi:hypothetical protein
MMNSRDAGDQLGTGVKSCCRPCDMITVDSALSLLNSSSHPPRSYLLQDDRRRCASPSLSATQMTLFCIAIPRARTRYDSIHTETVLQRWFDVARYAHIFLAGINLASLSCGQLGAELTKSFLAAGLQKRWRRSSMTILW